MSLLGRCTLKAGRVLLSSTKPRWLSHNPPSIPTLPTPSSFLHTTPPCSTAIYTYPIGSKPPLRRTDREARTQVFDTLLYLLRSGSGRELGLDVRPDGYLSVRQLLNYPLFRAMDLLELQELIESDGKYRFELLFDPLKGAEAWWIRAKLWDERRYNLLPCRLIHGVRLAVYKTTLEDWNNHISRTGIPLLGKEYIQIDRTIKTEEYIDNLDPESQVFIFLDIQKCILSGLRFSYLVQISSHISPFSPLVTKGNHLNLIPPSLFERVELVHATKTHLWGAREVGMDKTWPVEPYDLDETGRRKTMLPLLGKSVHGFVDILDFDVEDKGKDREGGFSVVNKETMKEAKEVIEEVEELERGSPYDVQRPREAKVMRTKLLRPRPSPATPPPSQQAQATSPTSEEDSSGLLKPWKPTSIPFFPRPRKQKPVRFRFAGGSPRLPSERRKTFSQRKPSSDSNTTETETVFGEGKTYNSRPTFTVLSPSPSPSPRPRPRSGPRPGKASSETSASASTFKKGKGKNEKKENGRGNGTRNQIVFIGRTGTKWKGKRGKRGKGRRGKDKEAQKKPSRKNRKETHFWPSYFSYYTGSTG